MFKTFLAVTGGVVVGGALLEIGNILVAKHFVKKVIDAAGGFEEFRKKVHKAAEEARQAAGEAA